MADVDRLPQDEAQAEAFRELERGLRFGHVMMTVIQDQGNEAVAYVQALADLLVQKGLISEEEIEEPLARARETVSQVLMPRVRLADGVDKYAQEGPDIDCASLVALCGARCCTFKFFLSKQDLDEGVVRWDYGNPYWISQREDGTCVHLDPETCACSVHAQRPYTCRRYDCRHDKRVWLDFEARIPAAPPAASGNAPVAMAEVALRNAHGYEENEAGDAST